MAQVEHPAINTGYYIADGEMKMINKHAVFVFAIGAFLFSLKLFNGNIAEFTFFDWLPLVAASTLAIGMVVIGRVGIKKIVLDVRPNEITVVGEQDFQFGYSAHGRFVADGELLEKAFDSVAGRLSLNRGKFMSLKETPLVRIWPGESGITQLELDAICHAVHAHFIEPEFEVMEDGFRAAPTPQYAASAG